MKKIFRFIFLALVLLVVALVSALTTMRFAIHGREVSVPNFLDKAPAEARRIAEENGLTLTMERQYYSNTIAEGKIVSQVPLAGTKVRRGWEVRVADSLGPQRVQIPNVLGQSDRAAEMNIERRGLDISSIAELPWPTDAANQVLAQSPSPNANGVATPKISLLIATQPAPSAFVMPSFIGRDLGSVTAIIKTAGMRVGTVTQAGSIVPVSGQPIDSPSSIVASQTPSAGEKVSPGAVVNLEVR